MAIGKPKKPVRPMGTAVDGRMSINPVRPGGAIEPKQGRMSINPVRPGGAIEPKQGAGSNDAMLKEQARRKEALAMAVNSKMSALRSSGKKY